MRAGGSGYPAILRRDAAQRPSDDPRAGTAGPHHPNAGRSPIHPAHHAAYGIAGPGLKECGWQRRRARWPHAAARRASGTAGKGHRTAATVPCGTRRARRRAALGSTGGPVLRTARASRGRPRAANRCLSGAAGRAGYANRGPATGARFPHGRFLGVWLPPASFSSCRCEQLDHVGNGGRLTFPHSWRQCCLRGSLILSA